MKTNALVLMLWLVLGLAACAVSPEPYEYEPDNELKPGPGLFSGEEGKFTIFRIPEEKGQRQDAPRKEQKGDQQE